MSLGLEKEWCCNRAHEHARVEGRPRPIIGARTTQEELEDKIKQRPDESPGAWVKRLQKIYTEMDEYNSMLEREGEDCWDDESMDEEEEREEQELEKYWGQPQSKKDEVQGAEYVEYHDEFAVAGEVCESELLEDEESEESGMQGLLKDGFDDKDLKQLLKYSGMSKEMMKE
jgi:hypothetical protein